MSDQTTKPYTPVMLGADFLRGVGLAPTTASDAALRLLEVGFKRHEIFGFETGKRVFLYVDARVAPQLKATFLAEYGPKDLSDDAAGT